MKSSPLKGRTAVLTGASRGIGRVLALALLREGVTVIGTAAREKNFAETVADAEGLPGGFHAIGCDFNREDEIETLAERILSIRSTIDFLINNAGTTLNRPILETSTEEWLRCLMVNATAPFILTRDLLPTLEQSDRGTIINIASVVGHKGYLGQAAYGASKHAFLGFAKVLAREVQPKGIRVHTISPGAVATEMVREARPDLDPDDLIRPEEIADLVLYLFRNRGTMVLDDIRVRRATGEPWY